MKRLLILLILLSITGYTAFAQITDEIRERRPQTTAPVSSEAVREGNWIIGANIANIGMNFKSDFFTLNINPRAGYFISDNAAIGTEVQLGLDVYDGGETFRYGLTPFVRYYFPEGAAPTHRWFGEAVAGIAGSSEEDSEGDSVFSTVLGLRAGYAHFVAQNVALEGILGYTRTSADISVGSGSSGLNLALGLQIYLPSRGR
ncbi:hypothetical protein ABID22_001616 [Pontibacter aydingkolensis]|uniref:Outer membrane protein beta-barrel domain-containing protein n=1 Tax=Pontibacter aydingkolensis TaxID=1911536 RepID=A0ABS7CTV3_9BACT|nr:hypothetical protein [Pontibacter aydingkolensis]MBW7467283.1 hypothetical protein [Pontibacter aydingkolensis]